MSGSTQSGDGTTTTKLNPQVLHRWEDLYGQAQDVSQNLDNSAVPQQAIAGLTADQQGADAKLNDEINNHVGLTTVHQAANAALNATNYAPTTVDPSQINGRDVEYLTGDPSTAGTYQQADKTTAGTYQQADKTTAGTYRQAQNETINRSAVSNVDPGSVLDHLGQYKDPYQSQVVDQTISDAERARQIQQQSDKASAIAAGAFGGSREGVAKAQTNDAYQRNLDTTLAGLNSAGFTQATNLSNADQNRDLTAQQNNQQADLSVFGQNASQLQQTALANAAGQAARQDSDAALKQQVELANTQGLAARQDSDAALKQQVELANTQGLAARQQFDATQKQGMTDTDLAAANAARMQTAANDQQARVLNSQQDLTAQQANQGAGLTANSQATAAAGLLGQLGGQQQSMVQNDINALDAQGGLQQTQAQNQLNADYANAQAVRNAPVDALKVAESPFQITLPSTSQGGTSTSNSSGKGMGI